MRKTLSKRLVISLLVFVLALPAPCLLPLKARAEGQTAFTAHERSEAEIDELVGSMLASGDYVEGEAVVCYLDRAAVPLGAQSEDPLSGAERLSEVSARQYAEATGEEVPAAPGGVLAPQAEDEPVGIVLVRSDMGTAQLLSELLRDPRVLSAEPNYIMAFDEDDSDDAFAAEVLEDQPQADAEIDEELDEGSAILPQTDVEDEGSQAEEPVEVVDATPVVAQGDPAGPATEDLTNYQWFTKGVANSSPQYPDGANPGVQPPNWNEQGKTNASGVVAILDSGVDYDHPDLAKVMYEFTPELQDELGCGKYGYAPARENKKDPMDGDGHGTHCAGIVAAEWNDKGVSGVASGVQLCAVSVAASTSDSNFSYDSIIKGYDFLIRAANAGVDIRAVNRSLSMDPATNANDVMVQAAGEVGIVTCEASGNEHEYLDNMHTDIGYLQPSPYVIRVDASNPQDGRAPFSNYGQYTTDVFAPGTSILSLQPTGQESLSRYYPQADADPLYIKTDFSDARLDVPSGKEVQVGDVSAGTIGFDGDGSSLKAGISTETGSYAHVYVDVPVGNLSKYDVQDIRLAFNIGRNEARFCGLSIMLDDEENTFIDSHRGAILDASDPGPNGWCIAGLHIINPDGFDGDFAHVIDSYGNTCIRLSIDFRPYDASYEPEVRMDTDIYIDQIAIGRKGNSGFLPYCYMNGTSMAAPVVTGCAAIVSSTFDAASPAERAEQTVRLLRGAVRQAEGYQGYCKQNGQVDLRLLGEGEALVPVIESARVDGKTLVVEGENFTQGGTLLVAGKEVKDPSWSDGLISAAWPEGVASGLIPIVVRTAEGAEACRAFIMEAPEGVTGSAPLYERDITPINLYDDGTSTTAVPKQMVATEDGILFAVVEDSDDRTYSSTRFLVSSDDQGVSWKAFELPMALKDVSIAMGDGTVYVLGAAPADREYGCDSWELYGFDLSEGAFRSVASLQDGDEGISKAGALAYVHGHLYHISNHNDIDDWSAPSRMCLRCFDFDARLFGEEYRLEHAYDRLGLISVPKVAVVGKSMYVFATEKSKSSTPPPVYELTGLERVDFDDDGNPSCVDLSDALMLLEKQTDANDACIAASKDGVFLISPYMEDLLPDGADRTDTFFLKNDGTQFEPYPRTLSFAQFTYPVSVYSNGWLYAYGVSKYEDTTIFGRATKVSEEEKPDPDEPDDPTPEPTPTPSPLPKTGDVGDTLCRCSAVLFLVGLSSVAVGLKTLRPRREADE